MIDTLRERAPKIRGKESSSQLGEMSLSGERMYLSWEHGVAKGVGS